MAALGQRRRGSSHHATSPQAGEAIQRGPTIAQPTSPRKQFSMLKKLRRDISMHHFIEARAFRK
jgi:hypothetical protein